MQFDLFHPVLDGLEGLTLVYCVGEEDAHRAAVVGLGDGFETLLAGCVPDLKADFVFAQGDCFYFEVDADCC